jgi:hypothetical protein
MGTARLALQYKVDTVAAALPAVKDNNLAE